LQTLAPPGASSSRPSSWFVVKPPPREKNVLLHPAKFPEPLVDYFLGEFSHEGENVFDPMAGTGSTLLAALTAKRRAYGIELNAQFHGIACTRLQNFEAENAPPLPENWRLNCGDAALAESYHGLPETFDYILTSPPYWDMLRMKGAETQQKRQQAGLLQFYSEDARDLGNRSDYEEFLADLIKIYRRVAERLAAGRYMTVIVKNVKKRGKVYPLAWHLAMRLSEQLLLCHEQFWCQDDQRLAPFGYRYTWVSNTFHHYCLHFRKPA
jgi:16S rRNA G966 N2-methylase RsmD